MERFSRWIGQLLLATLTTFCGSAQTLSWQQVLPDEAIVSLHLHEGHFLIQTTGQVFLRSIDGIQWTALEEINNGVRSTEVNSKGLLLQEFSEAEGVLRLRFTEDLEHFTTVFSYPLDSNVQWLLPLQVFKDVFVTGYSDGLQAHLLVSPDGVSWTAALTVAGDELGRLRESTRDTLVLHQEGTQPGKWAESADGLTWKLHQDLIGEYARAAGGWIGVSWNGQTMQSQDRATWSPLPVNLKPPVPVAGNGEKVILMSLINYETRITTDGLHFVSGLLPVDPSRRPSGGISLKVHDGIFWFTDRPRTEGDPIYYYSENGVDWIASETPPTSPKDAGSSYNAFSRMPALRELHEQTGARPIATSITRGELTVAIEEQADGFFRLIERQGGDFRFVGTNWIPRHGDLYEYVPEARKLVENNGVFLCLAGGKLGRMDPSETYFPQVALRSRFAETEEERIEAIDSIHLEWSPVPGAVSYQIYRYPQRAGHDAAVFIGETSENQFLDFSAELERGSAYGYMATTHGSEGRASLPGAAAFGALERTFEELFDFYIYPADSLDIVVDPIITIEPWPTPSPLNSAWRSLTWWERVYKPEFPWVYSVEHGWWYLREVRWGFWTYDEALGWFWSHRTLYPQIYLPGVGWRYYLRGTTGPRWFYDYSIGDWVTD
jgi:hypothetical protein